MTATKEEVSFLDLSTIAPIVPPTAPSKKFSALFYGKFRAGKSFLAASAEEVEAMSPVLYIAVEDGTTSFVDEFPGIDVIHPESTGQLMQIVDAVCSGKTKYRTAVLDTVGASQELIKKDWLAVNKKSTFELWEKVADGILYIANRFHESELNTIMLAHVDKVKDGIDGGLILSPYALGNKAPRELPTIPDVVAYLARKKDDNGKPIRVLYFQGDDKVEAGSRYENKLPEYMVDPNMKKIHSLVTSTKK